MAVLISISISINYDYKKLTNKHTENPHTDREFNYRGHSITVPMERRVERDNIATKKYLYIPAHIFICDIAFMVLFNFDFVYNFFFYHFNNVSI